MAIELEVSHPTRAKSIKPQRAVAARVDCTVCSAAGAARLLFAVPMAGSFALLTAALLLIIVAALAVGFLFSTLARSQLQSMQMTMFYFLPNMLLSGFMFPFRGMLGWSQAIGEVLPLTHFLGMVRAIMLKRADPPAVWPQAWPIGLFSAVVGALALARYRQTLY